MKDIIIYSVYSLISDLCEKIIGEIKPSKSITLTDVKKLRNKSYEILLKKSNCNINYKSYVDPLKELDIILFATKIKAINDCKSLKNVEDFEKIFNEMVRNTYFANDSGKDVLTFLLLVKDSVFKKTQYENEFHSPLLVPGPFTLHLEYTKSSSYPTINNKFFSKKLEYLKNCTLILDSNNPYLPKFLFEKTKSEALEDYKTFKLCLKKNDNFKCISYNYLQSVASFKFLKSIENTRKGIEPQIIEDVKKQNHQLLIPKRFGWNWENLGSTHIQPENQFGSELGALSFGSLISESLEKTFEAKTMNLESFLADLKSLLVGIESESFYLDENITFHMTKNLTVSGVVPSIIKNFVSECLECGTCYRRMQIMVLKKDFQLMFDGFIYKALCCAIDDYLMMFRQFIFSYNDSKLLEFYQRVKRIMKQIINLAYILTIHPKVNANVKPQLGSQFLGYIYKEIMRITQPDMLSLLVFILKQCCHVYFKYLQKWIFLGHLDDPANELFICYVDYYNPNTKYFFDKAYFIRKEFVPGFFQGYEDYILQCGKYTMLLKAFNPNHPVFSIDFPPITVCLSFDELKNCEESCEKYLKQAKAICDSPITIQDIYNQINESKKNNYKLIHEKSQKHLENWKVEKLQHLSLDVIKKRKLFEEITAQIEEKKMLQNKEKMQNILEERKLKQQQEKHENNILQIEQLAALKQISCLEELKALHEKSSKPYFDFDDKTNTSVSTIDSEFESCGEDEFENDFKDCSTQNDVNVIIQNNDDKISNLTNFENKISKETDALNIGEIIGKIECSEKAKTFKDDIQNKNLTEAQRNKIKVLGTEYNIYHTGFKDLNCNSLDNKFETQFNTLKRNTTKSISDNSSEKLKKDSALKKLTLDLKSERDRNRKRNLGSEFFAYAGSSSHIGSENTPMSTSSDSCLENDLYDKENINKLSVENINIVTSLKNSKENFNFEKQLNTVQSADVISSDIKFETNVLQNEIVEHKNEFEKSDFCYKKCIELIKNNFHCKPTTGLIELKDISESHSFMNNDRKIAEILNKQGNINSLSVITLTEFLQKSVTIPLRTHLQIMNNEVMRVFLVNLNIIGHFNSLRNYFFLMDGEFSSIICDELISKLENGVSPAELFNYQTLHTVLDKAIGSSNFSDKNSDNLSFIVSDVPDKFDLLSPSVFSNICLSYRVTWPLNLILNPETLDKYGDIFKYLFKVRRISWVLEQSFRILNESAKSYGKDLLFSPQYRHIQLIRHKFFHFVNALRNHITASALQSSWKEFEDELLKVKCVEEIYKKHTTYIKKILFLCMLNKSSADFYKTIENIFKIALRFYRNLKCRQWRKKNNDNYYTHPRFDKILIDEAEFEKLVKYVIYLGNKIVKRGYQEEIGELINLVNYNKYYLIYI